MKKSLPSPVERLPPDRRQPLTMGAGRPVLEPRKPPVLTVSQLAGLIRGTLEEGLDAIWVVGEISNFKPYSSGHCFFTLKDSEACIDAVMWRNSVARLRFRPGDGLEVLASGRIGFWEKRGSLRLVVDTLEPRGEGALRQQLERLRQKLEAEGLLDPARKRPLPFLPACIGIVTALGGAAIRDMLRMLRDRYPNLRIVVRPVRVQGIGAELEIAEGIRDLQGVPEVEVLIVGRGGGSIEDLWAFNDEGVARAIVACRVPVVSAVGHEIDVTIADLVADARAPTPTAAAEMVIPRRVDLGIAVSERSRALVAALGRALAGWRRGVVALRARLRDPRRDLAQGRLRLREADRRLLRAFLRGREVDRRRIEVLAERLRQGSPRRSVNERRIWIERIHDRLEAGARHRIELSRARFSGAAAALSGLSPLAVLGRGYAVVWKAGTPSALRAATEVRTGDDLEIRLHRGRLRARATEVDPGDGPESVE